MTRKCEYPGCDEKHHARGYCRMHHLRQIRGQPMDGPSKRRLWTEHEDNRIIVELMEEPTFERDWQAIARELDRTPEAVLMRSQRLRRRLGIPPAENWR